jgi:hypothetical protein
MTHALAARVREARIAFISEYPALLQECERNFRACCG